MAASAAVGTNDSFPSRAGGYGLRLNTSASRARPWTYVRPDHDYRPLCGYLESAGSDHLRVRQTSLRREVSGQPVLS